MNAKVIIKYAAIHGAELGIAVLVLLLVRHFLAVPVWVIATILLAAVIKDLVFFPKVWRAYATVEQGPLGELEGLEATVVQGIGSEGYVMVRGELWRAVSLDTPSRLTRGDRVKVVGSRGMTLLVAGVSNDRQSLAGSSMAKRLS